MYGLSASHLIILGLIVLLFGAKRLPELGANLGKALHAFKSATDGRQNELTHQSQEKPKELV